MIRPLRWYESNNSEETENTNAYLYDLLAVAVKVSGGQHKNSQRIVSFTNVLQHCTLGKNIGFAVGMLHSVVKHGSRSAWPPRQGRQSRLYTTHGHKDTKKRKSDGLCTRSPHFFCPSNVFSSKHQRIGIILYMPLTACLTADRYF